MTCDSFIGSITTSPDCQVDSNSGPDSNSVDFVRNQNPDLSIIKAFKNKIFVVIIKENTVNPF